MCYMRKFGYGAAPAKSRRGGLNEFQERTIVTHRPRSGGIPISNDDVARFKNVFQENPRNSQNIASAEHGILILGKELFVGNN